MLGGTDAVVVLHISAGVSVASCPRKSKYLELILGNTDATIHEFDPALLQRHALVHQWAWWLLTCEQWERKGKADILHHRWGIAGSPSLLSNVCTSARGRARIHN